MRLALEKALKEIKNKTIEIMNMGKESVYYAVKYITEGGEESKNRLNELEIKSDSLNVEIQDLCLVTMARQQPVARDMRFIASMMNISSFFERICDLSQEVLEEAFTGESKYIEEIKTKILWMAQKVISMIDIVLEAMINEDISKLKEDLESYDNEIDKLFDEAREDIEKYIKEDLEHIKDYIRGVLIIKYLERIGDIVAKTGARIIYIEEGKHVLIK